MKVAKEIIKELNNNSHEAYLVGGCVRDMFLKRNPKDFDIATSATPNEVLSIFNKQFKCLEVGKSFGVIILIDDMDQYEVATFRKDSKYSDCRRPDFIEFSSAIEDAKRRDFTINGMFYDVKKSEVIDFVNGIDSIQNREIKFIGDAEERIKEDSLRMLRAIRFACQLRFSIETETKKAIKKHSKKIKNISWERIKMEIEKILLTENASQGIQLLRETNLLKHILPEIDSLYGIEQPKEYHEEGCVFTHTMLTLDYLNSKNFVEMFAALIHDVGKKETFKEENGKITFISHDEVGANIAKNICNRFKMSNDETDAIVYIVKNHMRIKFADKMKKSKILRMAEEEYFSNLVNVTVADSRAASKNLKWETRINELLSDKPQERKRIIAQPFINGYDLIKLGVEKGPIFKEIISDVVDEQLEGRLQSKEDAIKYIKIKWHI